MREGDEITGLFRSRLADAEMTVREGFWEELQRDLPSSASVKGGKRLLLPPRFYRVAAAASVVFVLGAASAAFWYFSPKEEIKEAFTQVAAMTPEGSLNGDVVQESFPSIHQADPVAHKPGAKHPVDGVPVGAVNGADDETVAVHVSITITQRVYGNRQQSGENLYGDGAVRNSAYQNPVNHTSASSDANPAASTAGCSASADASNSLPSRPWGVKAAVGTSLPKNGYDMPFTAGVAVERSLNNYLALEAGLRYSCLPAARTLHTLAVPVRLNAVLASSSKVDFYATVGGAVEKCIAGAPDNSFRAEPVQLSVEAGVGVRYKMSDRFALFAEPSVSHHFDTDSQTKSLRTDRPVNLNLLCGVRMTY